MPDVLALRDGRVQFIEFKRPGGKTSDVQKAIHTMLADQGFETIIIDK